MQNYIKKINKDKWVGIKVREMKDYNYKAIWNNLTTVRMDMGEVKELPANYSEFYDVSLGTLCNAGCNFCLCISKKEWRILQKCQRDLEKVDGDI